MRRSCQRCNGSGRIWVARRDASGGMGALGDIECPNCRNVRELEPARMVTTPEAIRYKAEWDKRARIHKHLLKAWRLRNTVIAVVCFCVVLLSIAGAVYCHQKEYLKTGILCILAACFFIGPLIPDDASWLLLFVSILSGVASIPLLLLSYNWAAACAWALGVAFLSGITLIAGMYQHGAIYWLGFPGDHPPP